MRGLRGVHSYLGFRLLSAGSAEAPILLPPIAKETRVMCEDAPASLCLTFANQIDALDTVSPPVMAKLP